MTAQSWQTLRTKKYQLSLRLFLFLNAVSALFAVAFPIFPSKTISPPGSLILVLSTALLTWHVKYAKKRINLHAISLLFGGLWAAHITLKYLAQQNPDYSFLLVALLTVLFIGSIAFANNIIAFTLHSLPSLFVCLWLNGHEHGLQLLFLWPCPWPVSRFSM